MDVEFVSRSTALELISDGIIYNYDLISISDTWGECKRLRNEWIANKQNNAAAKFYVFQDIDAADSGFTDRTAQSIIQFIDESYKKKSGIVVHCFAGVSRSGAVAKFINDYLGLQNEYLENYVGHNRWVYYTLLDNAGIPTLRSFYKDQEQE